MCVAATSQHTAHLVPRLSLAFVGCSHPPRLDTATQPEDRCPQHSVTGGYRDHPFRGKEILVQWVGLDTLQYHALPSGSTVPVSLFILHDTPPPPPDTV